jgi:hypothetical protein
MASAEHGKLTEAEIAWLAGLLEGEGCFGVKGPNPSNAHRYPYVVVRMTDRDVVERVATLMGGNVVTRSHTPSMRSRGEQPIYRYWLVGSRALHVMRLLRPWMGERRTAKVDALLAEFPTLGQPQTHCKRGHRLVLRPNGSRRYCRICNTQQARDRRLRIKKEVA